MSFSKHYWKDKESAGCIITMLYLSLIAVSVLSNMIFVCNLSLFRNPHDWLLASLAASQKRLRG